MINLLQGIAFNYMAYKKPGVHRKHLPIAYLLHKTNLNHQKISILFFYFHINLYFVLFFSNKN